MKKQKIIILVGTRPEAIKMAPIFYALQECPFFEIVLVSTGQHHEMLLIIFLI